MSDADDIFAFLADQLADHDTTWSLGTFGAIAEFARDPDEPVALRRGDAVLAAVTARGAIRIEAGAARASVRLREHHAGELEPARRDLPAGRALRHEPADRAHAAGA